MALPSEHMEPHNVPHAPTRPFLTFDTTLTGNPSNGFNLVSRGACIGCHTIKGVPGMVAETGPNLTHVGSRLTIAGGIFPNDTRHLTSWINNSRAMKPGGAMPTQGKDQYDPVANATMSIGFTVQQIA